MPITSLTSYLNTASFGDTNASTRNQQELALTLDCAARQLADFKGLALMSAGGGAFEVGKLLATTFLSAVPLLSAIPLLTRSFTFVSGVTADTAFTTFLSQIFGEAGENDVPYWQQVLDQGSVRGMGLLGAGQGFAVMQLLTGLASLSGGMLCEEKSGNGPADGAFLHSLLQGLRCHFGSGAFGYWSGGVLGAVEQRISLKTRNMNNVGANLVFAQNKGRSPSTQLAGRQGSPLQNLRKTISETLEKFIPRPLTAIPAGVHFRIVDGGMDAAGGGGGGNPPLSGAERIQAKILTETGIEITPDLAEVLWQKAQGKYMKAEGAKTIPPTAIFEDHKAFGDLIAQELKTRMAILIPEIQTLISVSGLPAWKDLEAVLNKSDQDLLHVAPSFFRQESDVAETKKVIRESLQISVDLSRVAEVYTARAEYSAVQQGFWEVMAFRGTMLGSSRGPEQVSPLLRFLSFIPVVEGYSGLRVTEGVVKEKYSFPKIYSASRLLIFGAQVKKLVEEKTGVQITEATIKALTEHLISGAQHEELPTAPFIDESLQNLKTLAHVVADRVKSMSNLILSFGSSWEEVSGVLRNPETAPYLKDFEIASEVSVELLRMTEALTDQTEFIDGFLNYYPPERRSTLVTLLGILRGYRPDLDFPKFRAALTVKMTPSA